MKKYYLITSCKKCLHILSRREVMHSHGVCPYCGNDSGDTICDVRRTTHLEDDGAEIKYWMNTAYFIVICILTAIIIYKMA